MFLAVIVFVISFWSLAGKEPPKSQRAAATVNVILLLVLVAVSAALSYVRQKYVWDSRLEVSANPLMQSK